MSSNPVVFLRLIKWHCKLLNINVHTVEWNAKSLQTGCTNKLFKYPVSFLIMHVELLESNGGTVAKWSTL